MKKSIFVLICLFHFTIMAQQIDINQFSLIETAEFIEEPKDLLGHVKNLKPDHPVVFVTFEKRSGELLDHATITKKALMEIFSRSNFEQRYFVVLIDEKAIFYMDL